MPAIRIAQCTHGRVLAQAGPEQEITPLPGIYFFDGWRVHPTLVIPANLPSTKEAPVCDAEAPTHSTASTEPPRSPEEEARDILATAAKNQAEDGPSTRNQAEDGPSTRRAAIRACKYLRAMVHQHSSLIQSAHDAAKIHTQRSKGNAAAMEYRPKEGELPVIAPELTSELLHCLSSCLIHGPWQKSRSIWKSLVSGSPKCVACLLPMNTPDAVGVPTTAQAPDIEPALKAVQNILPKLEARIIEFLSEWLVTFLIPAKYVLDTLSLHG